MPDGHKRETTTAAQEAQRLIDAMLERHARTGIIFTLPILETLVAMAEHNRALEVRLARLENGN